ncbi:MAG: DUF4340 domain-containing protein [Clostridia bacterium]|nr:DUF4340 domain-containing protein [Clostridia bacterium]MBR5366779.1 DUF4340 domain-containing protein [Clostridia bacterium]
MKIRNQKRLIIILGSLFLVLLIAWFAVLKPLTTVEDNKDVDLDLLDGEVMITSRLTNFYIFQPLEDRSNVQSIDVDNEFGGYRVYRDAADAFQLEGFPGLSFNQELFSSLVVTAIKPTAMMRVAQDLDTAGLAEYGLDKPRASWTVTSTIGEKYTMYVGDQLLTEGGYYVMYEGRPGAVYIMSETLADTILQPAYKLLSPLLTAGLSTNTYFFVDEFTVMHGEDLFVHVTRLKQDQMKNPDTSIVEVKLTWPRPENTANGEVYEINDDLYFQILYNFMALEGEEVVAFMPTDEELETFGLTDPAHTIMYNFHENAEESGPVYEFIIFVSEKQPDGSYYAVSNLYGYSTVVKVGADKLGWLEYDAFAWIFPTPFFENIVDVQRITLKGADVDVDYRLTHGTDANGNPTLDVTEVNSGVYIPNAEVNNFRQYYKTMLNITNQEYVSLTEEDKEALLADEGRVRLVMTYENASGEVTEFKFYQYYAASTGHISGGKIFVVVNGVGEFYTTNDLVDKVVNDTSRVLDGLDVDAYGHN